MSKPIDDDIRELAVSELDRNVVVTAGAGTGKTTLLVNRILHLLLGHRRFQTEESPVRRIVAMTFTEKAASDMKIRLMGELEKIVSAINGNAIEEEKRKAEGFLAHLRDEYRTTYSEIERRARKSLEDMDKALIGTIHGFAAHILRLYPLEAGVAPGFVVDKGDIFDELFDKEWTSWLEGELTLASPRADNWRGILRRLDLESVRNLARHLSGFAIPLDSLLTGVDNNSAIIHPHPNPPPAGGRGVTNQPTHTLQSSDRGGLRGGGAAPIVPSSLQILIDPIHNKILNIIPLCEKPKNNLIAQLHELSKILEAIKKQGIGYLNNVAYDLDKEASKAKSGWTDEGFEVARELVKECHTLLKKLKTVDDVFVKGVLDLVLPFAKAFRQKYLSQGYVSFDGLLTLTRDLLQNKAYRYIRDKLKDEFRTILVDEFQDTDPVQYEIVLFLSEDLGHYSRDARRVTLEEGKLFIVGDPKQSIYAFRRADIEAYEHVVKLVCRQDEPLKLQENFRSHSGIIEVVNQLFCEKIIVEKPGLQPPYIPIHANRLKKHPSQKVEIVAVFDKEGEELKATDAREAEAEWIAQWITRHVNNEVVEDNFTENGFRKLTYKDVALLLRAFTQVRSYVEALKRYGIPYLVEGEKYFYTTQEVLDFINLLRTIENPHDRIALVGVLRSPIVGLTDREIYDLHMNNLLDSGKNGNGDFGKLSPDFKGIVEEFYGFLRRMHARAGILPVSQLITEIMDNTHIAEITAFAWHGEQKLANIRKLYQMACDMEQSEGVSLKTFIDRIRVRIKEARDEGESPLSDETLDVVKIMTIHKSKGLEFPVVILGNLHGEVRNDNEELASVVFDWSTSTVGIVIGNGNQRVRNFQSVVIEKKLHERSWEEEKRVLYVAMTRAKERLVLTGAWKEDDKSYMGLLTQALRDVTGVKSGDDTCIHDHPQQNVKKIPLGNAEIFVEHFRFDGIHRPSKTQETKEWDTDLTSSTEIWKRRKATMDGAARTPLFTSPSARDSEKTPMHDISPLPDKGVSEACQNYAAMIGSVCHQVLQGWDFHGTSEELNTSVESAIKWTITAEKVNGNVTNQVPDFIHSQKTLPLSPPYEGEKKGVVLKPESAPLNTVQGIEFVKTEALKILTKFMDSEAYKELQGAQILGREVPILLAWNGQIMRGAIDILYKMNNHIVIADYKTDHVTITDLSERAKKYRYQKEIYVEAVKRSLKIDNPEFKLIFLRIGEAVPV